MDENQPNQPPPRPTGGEPVAMRAAPGNAALPPHPLNKRWYAHVDGQNYGPYSGHDIKRMVEKNQIHETDFLCPDGGSAWTQAKNEPLLGALFRARTQSGPPPVTAVSAEGGTVVQVTNNIPSPNLAHAALMMNSEAAAKSPGIALLLSLLICGVGQMYNGQVAKGILMLLGCIALWFVLLGWVVWIWSMVDAYTTAKRMNLLYQQRVMAGLM